MAGEGIGEGKPARKGGAWYEIADPKPKDDSAYEQIGELALTLLMAASWTAWRVS